MQKKESTDLQGWLPGVTKKPAGAQRFGLGRKRGWPGRAPTCHGLSFGATEGRRAQWMGGWGYGKRMRMGVHKGINIYIHIHIVDSKLILYWHLLTWYFEYLMNPSTSMWCTISAPRLLVNAIVFSLKTTRELSWCNGWRVAMRVAMGSSTKICWLFP